MDINYELREAIDSGDLDKVREHFKPSDLASNDYGGDSSVLHYAAEYGTLDIVKFLVEQGAELDRLGGTWKAPPVTYSANEGKLDIVRYLVEAGAIFDISRPFRNPLLRAAEEGHLDVVEYLLTTTINGHATYRLPIGTLVNALVEAEQNGHEKVVALLKAHGCHRPVEGVDIPLWEPPEQTREDDMSEAVENGDLSTVRALFEPSDLASNDYESGDSSLLHLAAEYGTQDIVRFLIEQGAEINRPGGTFKAPPVTYAARMGTLDIVRYLVEAGSIFDISRPTRNPLLQAAGKGHLEVVEYLLTTTIDRHATYRLPTGALFNALVEAEQKGHQKIAALLKAHGCHRPVEGVDIPLWEPPLERRLDLTPEFKRYQETIRYMEQRFGPADPNGMLELLPVIEGMSVAINVIRPNEVHPYLVLFTNGMSDRPMKVPPGQDAWRYAELVMHLPADWVHPRDAKGDPKWLWPVQWLRKLAYYPHLNDTWLGLPATIVSSDDPPVPLGPNTAQTCLFMVPDYSLLNPPLQRADGSLVHFYTVTPLYTEERDFEKQHGMKAFLTRFSQARVPMNVNLNRPNFGVG